jgi:hypothetical protein
MMKGNIAIEKASPVNEQSLGFQVGIGDDCLTIL